MGGFPGDILGDISSSGTYDPSSGDTFPTGSASGGATGGSPGSGGGILGDIWGTLEGGGGVLQGLENLGIGASDIFGTIGNIELSEAEAQALNQEIALMNKGAGLFNTYSGLIPGATSNINSQLGQLATRANQTPAQTTASINQFVQPLNQNLITGINQQVAQQLASQGLAQSPGIMAASTAQALAPYEQQNQYQGANQYFTEQGLQTQDINSQLQAGFQELGLPISALNAIKYPNLFPPPAQISPLITNSNVGGAPGTTGSLPQTSAPGTTVPTSTIPTSTDTGPVGTEIPTPTSTLPTDTDVGAAPGAGSVSTGSSVSLYPDTGAATIDPNTGLTVLPIQGEGGAATGVPTSIPTSSGAPGYATLGGADTLASLGGVLPSAGGAATEGAAGGTLAGVADLAGTGVPATGTTIGSTAIGGAEAGADTGAGAAVGSGLATAALGLGLGAGIGALAYELLTNIGPSANNVPTAQWNQTLLSAGDDILAAAKAGDISETEATNALQTLVQTAKSGWNNPIPTQTGGTPTYPSGYGSQQFTNAQNNAISNLNSLLGALPAGGPAAPNIPGAESQFLAADTTGWYPGSIESGNAIATDLLTGDWTG
jgi:hypothetical protein